MAKFRSTHERAYEERVERITDAALSIPFGVKFLDETLTGIRPTDILMIGAMPGCGKTELAVEIALQCAKQGRDVHMFALEAENNEVERRMRYKIIADMYLADGGKEYINYQDWVFGKLQFLEKYDDRAEVELLKLPNLHTLYREGKFTIETFAQAFEELKGNSSLVIIDHIHFIDYDGDNENRAMSEIVHRIRELSLQIKIPVVMIAHLRKIPRGEKTLIPHLDDFHGTGALGKVATRSVILAPGPIDANTGCKITYMRAVKNRPGGDRCSTVGKLLFDQKKNCYRQEIKFGYLSPDEKSFMEYSFDKPEWISKKDDE